MNNLQIKIRGP